MAETDLRESASTPPTVTGAGRVDHVGRSGIYPASHAGAPARAERRGQGELGHPEERRANRLLRGARPGSRTLTLGRLLFGGYFLYNGINHLKNTEMMTGYARSKGVPAPRAAVIGTGAMLVAGGLSFITGFRPRIGSALVTTFLLGVSPKMHAFWAETDRQQRMSEMVNFTKNMALIGGSMFAASVPEPWRG